MLKLYSSLMNAGTPVLKMILLRRSRKGKEDSARLAERMGTPSILRPNGKLAWFHAASVGEAQSALILIDEMLKINPALHILVTTGTVTSADLMQKRLPKKAVHQYIPLDSSRWTEHFLDHWRPDIVFWLESELWPNLLQGIRERQIPSVLINARLSEKSFKRWKKSGNTIQNLLDTFQLILAQTEEEASSFTALGAGNVIVSDNIKYSAAPLPRDEAAYKKLQKALGGRPVWLCASTHDGEEKLACQIHRHLKKDFPDLLTIVVPRHPERRETIMATCSTQEVQARNRGNNHDLPQEKDDLYIVDTLGELGLFYRLSPIAYIGRSFSNDGGGGHNPIEAAQLDSAVLHGPNIQNLKQIYKEMDEYGAAICTQTEKKLEDCLHKLLSDEEALHVLQNKATEFALNKSRVLERVLKHLQPSLQQAGIIALSPKEEKECA